MMLLLIALVAAATAAPVTYDQRQDGEYNVQADVQNVVLLIAIPQQKAPLNLNLLDGLFSKDAKEQQSPPEIQQRSDSHVMDAFVEPSTPYQVEIGEGSTEGEGRAVQVVIAGRRAGGADQLAAADDDLKLLGATEQCGPGRVRDPATLACENDPATPVETPPLEHP